MWGFVHRETGSRCEVEADTWAAAKVLAMARLGGGPDEVDLAWFHQLRLQEARERLLDALERRMVELGSVTVIQPVQAGES